MPEALAVHKCGQRADGPERLLILSLRKDVQHGRAERLVFGVLLRDAVLRDVERRELAQHLVAEVLLDLEADRVEFLCGY